MRSRFVAAIAALGLALTTLVVAPASVSSQTPGWKPVDVDVTVVAYGFPDGAQGPDGVIEGPDGRLWTALGKSNGLGAIDPVTLERSVHPLPVPACSPTDVAAGPDGNIWFVANECNRVGYSTLAGSMTLFELPNADSKPIAITAGPDGNMWFTEEADRVGRITPAGVITEFATPTVPAAPNGIVAGPDGNLWFAESAADQVARITPAGVITEVPVTGTGPADLTVGPDGKVWFTEFTSGTVGTVDPATLAVGQFPIAAGSGPAPITTGDDAVYVGLQGDNAVAVLAADGSVTSIEDLAFSAVPTGILERDGEVWTAQGSDDRISRMIFAPSPWEELDLPDNTNPTALAQDGDGNLWFGGTGVVGRVTLDGELTTFPLDSGTQVLGIALGPDGNMWFTEIDDGQVSEIAPDGTITPYDVGPTSEPAGIVAGPDGNLWFVLEEASALGRIAPDGTGLVTFPTPTPNCGPSSITVGPDGNLWFTLTDADRVARATTDGVITEFPVTAGSQPEGITTGPDGNLWFNGFNDSTVGRITPAGSLTTFKAGGFNNVTTLGPGLDGTPQAAVWLAYFDAGTVGALSDQGVATDVLYRPGVVDSIAADGERTVWVGWRSDETSRLGRLVIPAPIEPVTPAVPAVPLLPGASTPAPAPAAIAVTSRPGFTG